MQLVFSMCFHSQKKGIGSGSPWLTSSPNSIGSPPRWMVFRTFQLLCLSFWTKFWSLGHTCQSFQHTVSCPMALKQHQIPERFILMFFITFTTLDFLYSLVIQLTWFHDVISEVLDNLAVFSSKDSLSVSMIHDAQPDTASCLVITKSLGILSLRWYVLKTPYIIYSLHSLYIQIYTSIWSTRHNEICTKRNPGRIDQISTRIWALSHGRHLDA